MLQRTRGALRLSAMASSGTSKPPCRSKSKTTARLVSFCSNINRSIASATVGGTLTDSVGSSRQPSPVDALPAGSFDGDGDVAG